MTSLVSTRNQALCVPKALLVNVARRQSAHTVPSMQVIQSVLCPLCIALNQVHEPMLQKYHRTSAMEIPFRRHDPCKTYVTSESLFTIPTM